MKSFLLCLLFATGFIAVQGQTKSPDEFLGYPLGSRFTLHEKVNDYFKYVASQHQHIKLISYGKSHEGRELLVAIVSAQENINNLEEIRKRNVLWSKGGKEISDAKKQPAILWLSYNVHGNEASSTETAMKMIYSLSQASTPALQKWLSSTVVIIDPCLNPDGRDRYVNFYNGVVGLTPNANPAAREHQEPWPRGRVNHYYFDLNRDWAWQTQMETQQRMALYQQWMPQVHVDFHEQSYNEPYYFAPAAEPLHENISSWQRNFQVTVGKNNAKYFDEQGWQYFTKQHFDLLYPSYGDTYPIYNGAIGMTYEQGGINAGLAVVTADGDTLTLKDRIAHHYTSGMATIETVSNHSEKLLAEFRDFFIRAVEKPVGPYQSYVVKANSLPRLKKLVGLLTKNHIEFAFGGDKTLKGLDFGTLKSKSFKLERNDLVINMKQPRSILAAVLFEPQTIVKDSNTYDITAWALPYAYGLTAYALKENIKGQYHGLAEMNNEAAAVAHPYAWAFLWNSADDARILIALQKAKLKVRKAGEGFTAGGKAYPAGTLLVYRKENEQQAGDVATRLQEIAVKEKITLNAIGSGFVESGKDFGAAAYTLINQPNVALVAGEGTSAQSVGQVWSFFEQELKYPVSLLNLRGLANLNLAQFNVLILPDGNYPKNIDEQLAPWVENGGKLILMEDAIAAFEGKKPFGIKSKEFSKEEAVKTLRYADKDKDNFNDAIPGAIFKLSLDTTHPLALGLGQYYALITGTKIYEPLADGWNVGELKPNAYLTGIAGQNVKKQLSKGLLYGVQPIGNGQVIYLGNDVLFRLFWESGKQLFTNAVFMVN